MFKKPLKDKVVFKSVLSRQKAKGQNGYIRAGVMSLVLSVVLYTHFLIFSDVNYPYKIPFFSILLSIVYYYAKEEKYTVQVVQYTCADGDKHSRLEVFKHRHLFDPMSWCKEVKSGDLTQSSIRLYKANGKYSLNHRTGKESYRLFYARGSYKTPFKAYYYHFIRKLCKSVPEKRKAYQDRGY